MKTDEILKQAEADSGESSISSAEKNFVNVEMAQQVFYRLKTKLFDIEEWNAHAMLSSYALFDKDGNEAATDKIEVGKFVRIALKASGKYDWIRIINLSDEPDELIITVKPTFDPTDKQQEEKTISHFFTDEATNNFCIYRKGEKIAFYVIGLNEKANTNETGGAFEAVRNVAVNAATYLGIQKSEWEKFCHHFLEDAADGLDEK